MKVLVLGATGNIGNGVARAFRRHGHVVYGLARTPEKANILAKQEILPVLGDLQQTNTWTPTAEHCNVIVNCCTFNFELCSKALAEVEAMGEKRKVVYIHTSGTWVYGSDSQTVKNELTPLDNIPMMVAQVPIHEAKIMESTKVMGIVLRPVYLYGYNGFPTAAWFKAATDGHLAFPVQPESRWSFVHVDDLGDVYVAAAERAEVVRGQVFAIANSAAETARDVLEAVKRVTGYKGEVVYAKPTNPYEECKGISTLISSRKAEVLLGWHPKHRGFVDDVQVFYEAWKAAQ